MLQYGFFVSFKMADPMLLIWGDDCLSELADMFRGLGQRRLHAVRFDDEPWTHTEHGCSVVFNLASGNHSVLRLCGTCQITSIHCDLTSEDLFRFAEQVEALAAHDCKAGHQYLDVLGEQPIQLMVSKGEYSIGWPLP